MAKSKDVSKAEKYKRNERISLKASRRCFKIGNFIISYRTQQFNFMP